MVTAVISHVEVDEQGVARIAGTRIKVVHIAAEARYWKWTADAIQLQHPHLTVGQVYSALAYYSDHKAEFDRRMEDDAAESVQLRAAATQEPSRMELEARRAGLPSA